MTKRIFNLLIVTAFAVACFTSVSFVNLKAVSNNTDSIQNDITDCIKKYASKWGENCIQCYNSDNSYKVFLRNVCTEKIDVKCAVQENTKQWKTFIRTEMFPNDTMVAYACNGTGKYRCWVKKAGDKSIQFPSDGEINATYNK